MESYNQAEIASRVGDIGGVYSVRKPARCPVKFFMQEVYMGAKSKAAGRPVFEDFEFIRKTKPGGDFIERKVRDQDKLDYPEQYKAFQEGLEPPLEGTGLDLWEHPLLTPAVKSEMKRKGVRTVEMLAEMSETVLQKLPPRTLEIRLAAQEFLKNRIDSSSINKLTAELSEKDKAIEKLMERLSALEANAKQEPLLVKPTKVRSKRKSKVKTNEQDPITDS